MRCGSSAHISLFFSCQTPLTHPAHSQPSTQCFENVSAAVPNYADNIRPPHVSVFDCDWAESFFRLCWVSFSYSYVSGSRYLLLFTCKRRHTCTERSQQSGLETYNCSTVTYQADKRPNHRENFKKTPRMRRIVFAKSRLTLPSVRSIMQQLARCWYVGQGPCDERCIAV